MDPRIFRRWAKAERGGRGCHLLVWHGLDVAAVLEVGFEERPDLLRWLAAALGAEPHRLRSVLLWLAALHDLGKVGSAFQAQQSDLCARLGIDVRGLAPYSREYGHDHLGFVLLREDPHLDPQQGVVRISGTPPVRQGVRDLLLSIFTGHHGRQPPARLGSGRIGWSAFRAARQVREADREVARAMVGFLADLFGLGEDPVEVDACGLRRVSFVLNGMFTVADWLGSAADFAFVDGPMDVRTYLCERARPTAQKVLHRLRPWPFDRPRPLPARSFRDLAPGLRPTPLQRAMDEAFHPRRLPPGPLLVLIQDATGSGKTEAADLAVQRLVAAHRAESAYIALPTMATADAAFARRHRSADGRGLAGLLFGDPCEPVLAHARALRRARRDYVTRAEGETGESPPETWFARSSRRVLLARLGVGTVDQALLGVLRIRHATVRLAGMLRKALVVDEVHSFDDHVLTLLEELLRHQAALGGSVVLLSATLAGRLRERLVRAFAEGAGWADVAAHLHALPSARLPVLAVFHAGGVLCPELPPAPARPVPLAFVHAPEACIAHLVDRARDGRSGIWFRNTVGDAVEAFAALRTACAEAGLPAPLLYHARFLPADRARIEAELLATAGPESGPDKRRGRIVVATQAAEQSLDLDFDELVSDLAPVDVLIQRLGRFRRHPRDEEGRRRDPPDGRPPTRALLHVPPFAGEPDRDWYRRFLPRAAAIYADTARLWLGLELLRRGVEATGAFDPVRDGPRILDGVYRPAEELDPELPEALRAALREHEGTAFATRETARRGRLETRRGLLEAWRADADLPEMESLPTTRLGESHELVLVVRDGDAVRFLVEEDDPLEDSRVRVPWRPGWRADPELQDAVARRLRQHLQERGFEPRVVDADVRALGFETLLPLERDGAGWRGVFRTGGGCSFTVRYDRHLGLHREA